MSKSKYNFKSDLEFSKKRENKVTEFDREFSKNNSIMDHDLDLCGADPLAGKPKQYRVELKTDRRCCGLGAYKSGTGNVAFEVKYNEKPSGIFKGNFDILIYDVRGKEKLFFTDTKSLQEFVLNHGFRIVLENGTENYLLNYGLVEKAIRKGDIQRAGDIDWFRTFFLPEPEMTEDEFAEYALENYL